MKKILALICIVVMTLCLAGCGKSIQEAKVGEIVEFGKYKGNSIEWIVVKEEEEKKLLLSKYAICKEKFHINHRAFTSDEPINYIKKHPYSHSDISRYLDRDFLYDCFTDEEGKKIIYSKVVTEVKTSKTTYKEESWHYIFLPVYEEIESQYRECRPARYANKVWTLEDDRKFGKERLTDFDKTKKDNCWYWTRKAFPAWYDSEYEIACGIRDIAVYIGPYAIFEGTSLASSEKGVRPMMWVKTK